MFAGRGRSKLKVGCLVARTGGPGGRGLIARSLPRGQGPWSALTSAPSPGESMPGLRGPRLPPAGILLALPFLPLLLLPAAPAPRRASYKPVIVVHGLFDSSYSFRHLLGYINEVWRGHLVAGRWGASAVPREDACGTESRPSGLSVPRELVPDWGELGGGRDPGSSGAQ